MYSSYGQYHYSVYWLLLGVSFLMDYITNMTKIYNRATSHQLEKLEYQLMNNNEAESYLRKMNINGSNYTISYFIDWARYHHKKDISILISYLDKGLVDAFKNQLTLLNYYE